MTGGIIQKTFNQFRWKKADRNRTYHHDEILRLEQKLIDAIKRTSFERELTPKTQSIVLLYDLIGDKPEEPRA